MTNVNCRLNTFVCRNKLSARVVNSDSVAVLKRKLACVNFTQRLLLGHSLALFKRQSSCVPHVSIFMRINDDDDDDGD